MAGEKRKKESIKRTKKKSTITKGKKTGKEKKLADLPEYKTAEKKKKKKSGGMMANARAKMRN